MIGKITLSINVKYIGNIDTLLTRLIYFYSSIFETVTYEEKTAALCPWFNDSNITEL